MVGGDLGEAGDEPGLELEQVGSRLPRPISIPVTLRRRLQMKCISNKRIKHYRTSRDRQRVARRGVVRYIEREIS